MNRQKQPSHWVLACIHLGVICIVLSVGATLVYIGIHDGFIHQEIVSRPAAGKGGGLAAYGARAVRFGIGFVFLGGMLIFAAVKLFSQMYKGTRL